MKQKFAYMAVTMVAASLGVFLCLYLVVSGIMGQTRRIMDDNDRNARFQTQMEAEENAFRHWVEGNDGNAREELENRIRETTETVKKLTKKKTRQSQRSFVLCGPLRKTMRSIVSKETKLWRWIGAKRNFPERYMKFMICRGI